MRQILSITISGRSHRKHNRQQARRRPADYRPVCQSSRSIGGSHRSREKVENSEARPSHSAAPAGERTLISRFFHWKIRLRETPGTKNTGYFTITDISTTNAWEWTNE